MTIQVATRPQYIVDANWHEIGALGEPAFANSWTNNNPGTYSSAAFRMDAEGWVRVKGLIASGTSAQTAFTLPVGYRPRYTQRFYSICSAGVAATITVFSDGMVVPVLMTGGTNAYVTLEAVQFPAWQTWDEFADRTTLFGGNVPYYNDAGSTKPLMVKRDTGMYVVNGIAGPSVAAIHHHGAPGPFSQMFPIIGVNSSTYFKATRGAMAANSTTTTYTVYGGEFGGMEAEDKFTALSLQNSWVNFSTANDDWIGAGYYRDHHGWVHLRGLVSTGSSATAVIATLPAGYRPAHRTLFGSMANSALCRIDVQTDGTIFGGTRASTTWMSLNSISFLAEQ